MNDNNGFPKECATCEHYDNWKGFCKKHNEYCDYVCECEHYELCKEFRIKDDE